MMSDIFNIFSIDWWMDENNNALQMTDSVLFLLLAIPVAYLLLCALFSKPLKVVTDSLYVMRRLEIRQRERENTTASIR